MWNNVRGNTSWSNLCHARVSEAFELFCTTHRGRKLSQYYYAVHKIIRSFRKYTSKHVRATRKRRNLRPFSKKRLRFDYVTLLECGNCFARSHSFLFSYQTYTQCIMEKWRLCVSLSRRIQCCVLPLRVCVQVPSTIFQVVNLDKDTYFSCYC